MSEKIVIGMSGGVDSSVAAYLLKEQGYDVMGVTMQTGSVSEETIDDAAGVASFLGIPYDVVDFREEFRRYVMDVFAASYEKGRTPNPCIVCNRLVKWESLLCWAQRAGANLVATGHYTEICTLPNGRYTLKRSRGGKDQTYVLYGLSQDQLRRTRMPLAQYGKEDVRKIARELGLPVASKPDSQEICFIPDQDYVKFLEEYTGRIMPKGHFVDTAGHVLGEHQGLWRYTVGQRKGLGIALGRPAFVLALRPETNEVVLGTNEETLAGTLWAEEIRPMAVETIPEGEGIPLTAQIRYSHQPAPGHLWMEADGRARFEFDMPQRAITPGQGVVFYQEDYIYAGGTIVSQGGLAGSSDCVV